MSDRMKIQIGSETRKGQCSTKYVVEKYLIPERNLLGITEIKYGNRISDYSYITLLAIDGFEVTRERLRQNLGRRLNSIPNAIILFEKIDQPYTTEEIEEYIRQDAIKLAESFRDLIPGTACCRNRTQQILEDAGKSLGYGVEYHEMYEKLMLRVDNDRLYDLNPDGSFTGQMIDWNDWDD